MVAVAAATVSGVDIAAVEGQSFTGNVVSGLACPVASATITWGDGTSSAGTYDGSTGVQGSHTYAEEGTYSGSVSYTYMAARPCQGSTGTASFQATVQDAPLSAAGVNLSGTSGQPLSGVVAHFTDANPGAGQFSAQINWGDGSSSAGTVAAAAGGGFDVTGTHTYQTAGSYPVSSTIADVGGATTTASSTAQVAQTALPPPSATIPTPADGATYTLGQVVSASYSCSPGAGAQLKPGADGCSAPIASGSPIDTSTAGAHTFVVIATDTDGQSATATSQYTVQTPPPPKRTLTVTTSGTGTGTVTGSDINCGGGPGHVMCSTTAVDGTQLTLTALPVLGSRFTGFTGGGCGAQSPCTVTLDASKTVSASFHECLAFQYKRNVLLLEAKRAYRNALFDALEDRLRQELKSQPQVLAYRIAKVEKDRARFNALIDRRLAGLPCDPKAGVAVVRIKGTLVETVKGNRLPFPVTCPKTSTHICAGKIKLIYNGKAIMSARFKVTPGHTTDARLTLTKTADKLIEQTRKSGRQFKGRLELISPGLPNGVETVAIRGSSPGKVAIRPSLPG
jgi:hypothetical protein